MIKNDLVTTLISAPFEINNSPILIESFSAAIWRGVLLLLFQFLSLIYFIMIKNDLL